MFLIKFKNINSLYFFFLLLILVFIKFSTVNVFADNYTVKNINIREQYDTNFNKDEVQKIFYEPIEKLIDKNNWSYRGAYDDDWIYMLDDEILWGATAKMVRALCDLRLR